MLAIFLSVSLSETYDFCFADDANACSSYQARPFSDWNAQILVLYVAGQTINVLIASTFTTKVSLDIIPHPVTVVFQSPPTTGIATEMFLNDAKQNDLKVKFQKMYVHMNQLSVHSLFIVNSKVDAFQIDVDSASIDANSILMLDDDHLNITYDSFTFDLENTDKVVYESEYKLTFFDDKSEGFSYIFGPSDNEPLLITKSAAVEFGKEGNFILMPISIDMTAAGSSLSLTFDGVWNFGSFFPNAKMKITTIEGAVVKVNTDIQGASWLYINDVMYDFSKITGFDFCYSQADVGSLSCKGFDAISGTDWTFDHLKTPGVARVAIVAQVQVTDLPLNKIPDGISLEVAAPPIEKFTKDTFVIDQNEKRVPIISDGMNIEFVYCVIDNFTAMNTAKVQSKPVQSTLVHFAADLESYRAFSAADFIACQTFTIVDENVTSIRFMSDGWTIASLVEHEEIKKNAIEKSFTVKEFVNVSLSLDAGLTSAYGLVLDYTGFKEGEPILVNFVGSGWTGSTLQGDEKIVVKKYNDNNLVVNNLPGGAGWWKVESNERYVHELNKTIIVAMVIIVVVLIGAAGVGIAYEKIIKQRVDYQDIDKP